MAKPLVTRGSFVAAYINNSGLVGAERTRGGFRLGSREFMARRCACDYEGCLGWAMHRPEPRLDSERPRLDSAGVDAEG